MGLDSLFEGGATCFFIKYKNIMYLVTAKHVLSGCENVNTKIKSFPDMHYVFLGNYLHSIPINTKETKRILPCSGLDLVIIKIVDTPIYKYINSVEEYLVPPFNEYKGIGIFGFPIISYKKDMFKTFPAQSEMIIDENYFTFHSVMDTLGKLDSTLMAINWTKNVTPSNVMGGYSSSPVFLQEKKSNQWRLVGLFSASKDIGRDSVSLLLLKADIIMENIKKIR
jgi:hypothetical protein